MDNEVKRKLEEASKLITEAMEIMDASAKSPVFEEKLEMASKGYGVLWDYNSGATKCKRIGFGSGEFADPVPAKGPDEMGSSPFDALYPWSGMMKYYISSDRRISALPFDSDCDEMVYIPKFWYMAYKSERSHAWLWSVSPTEQKGFKEHPGSGRFIGRFHTSYFEFEAHSASGKMPLTCTSWDDFKDLSEDKGPGWGMLDINTWSALQMLYLIEFADFDSQMTLGEGAVNDDWKVTETDGCTKYHTVKATGSHNQYRWVEDPFSNVLDWIDGFLGSTETVYINNDETTLELPGCGYVSDFGYDPEYDWAFIPSECNAENGHSDAAAYVYSSSSQRPARVGGSYSSLADYGFFFMNANSAASGANANLGSRLLFIP